MDVIAIVIFAIVGRSSHAEGTDLLGVFRTAWPFLVGALLGMLAGRIWRAPATPTSGIAIWLGALVAGMLLRYATGGGVQFSFVLVAGIVLALFLIGWRAAYALIRRAAHRPARPTA